MTKHEADVIGGLNMTDQISNEVYKQIMIAAQEENEVGEVLDEIRAEIEQAKTYTCKTEDGQEFIASADNIINPDKRYFTSGLDKALEIINKYRKEKEE